MPILRPFRGCLQVALLVLASIGQPSAVDESAYHRTLERVLKLLPKQPAQVVVVDPNQVEGDIGKALLQMDAFVIKGGRVVYLTVHSPILEGALKGWTLHEYILATVIWHEMAHIAGADEREAQRQEEALLTRYIMTERVDRGDGMRYLAMLKDRRREDEAQRLQDAEQTLSGPLMTKPIAVIKSGRFSFTGSGPNMVR